jgi:hypothetical protein
MECCSPEPPLRSIHTPTNPSRASIHIEPPKRCHSVYNENGCVKTHPAFPHRERVFILGIFSLATKVRFVNHSVETISSAAIYSVSNRESR